MGIDGPDPVGDVRSRLEEGGYAQAGNCFEAALATGARIARADPGGHVVRLVKGTVFSAVGDRRHWWLTVDGKVVDPTADQFEGDLSYRPSAIEAVDFDLLAFLLS